MGSAVSGALLVILADSIGRLAFLPLQLPAGIIISLIGGPSFCYCSGSAGTVFNGSICVYFFSADTVVILCPRDRTCSGLY
ncbi:iron chelate uptake ABC transporter family permease subunit [Escherichia coli]|uniref:iron chelate uptake ABC transporter family permease subunit n=1 Tax=Escherichia coli TaxID=562 RepID=UPI003F4E62ED